jgi:hypothetical protein
MGLGAAVVIWWLARRLTVRRLPSAALAIIGAAGIIWARGQVAPLPTIPSDVRVQIASPHTGVSVGSRQIEVTGTVEPSGAEVVVALRPETADRWWIHPVGPSRMGNRWRITVPLGTSTRGDNENFSIVALAQRKTDIQEDGAEWTATTLPDWPRSNAVIVRREDPTFSP